MTTPRPLLMLSLVAASAQHSGLHVEDFIGPHQMNADVKYLVANALPGHEQSPRTFEGEWFDVYSPAIRSRYSEVVWKTLEAVRLPEGIVARFSGSTAMAVTGYEVDVVRRHENGTETSVPCSESYNHHYVANIAGKQAVLVGHGEDMGHGHVPLYDIASGAERDPMGIPVNSVPVVQTFSEHNGNEARQSFHGLPRGVVQPIAQPDRFILNPMQINTRNPDGSGHVGGPLPRNSRAPANASYSGLIECPCTTRTKKTAPASGVAGTINGVPYDAGCKPQPVSDLLWQRNPTCEVASYVGGMACCVDGTFLLDAEQDVPPAEDEVFFKWRFYFMDFDPRWQRSAFHLEWSINGCDSGGPQGNSHNCRHIEYDVPEAPAHAPPEVRVHVVTSKWRVRDMMHPCKRMTDTQCADPSLAEKAGVYLVMVGGHCHAPACIDVELRNADSGEVLCKIFPLFGSGSKAKHEKDYLWLPPCQFGSEKEGLRPPPLLHLDTNLTMRKRANSTYYHPGVMGIFQMRAIYAAEGLPSLSQADMLV